MSGLEEREPVSAERVFEACPPEHRRDENDCGRGGRGNGKVSEMVSGPC